MLLAAFGCAPKAPPLTGPVVAEALPVLELEGSRRLVFRWRFADQSVILQGEGVARVTAPDSARLDFFVNGGLGGGVAFLFGDSLVAPGAGSMQRLLPPAPLLWAALGRLAIPPAADTIVTREGENLRADVGRDPTWRVTIGAEGLERLARIQDGRLRDYVSRQAREILYEHPGDRRSLRIAIERDERVPGFSDDIWQR